MAGNNGIGRCSRRTSPDVFPALTDGDRLTFDSVITALTPIAERWPVPVITAIARAGGSPFEVLIATILSLRTKDGTTAMASRRLFAKAKTPEDILSLPVATIAELIFPVGFYRVKAGRLKQISRVLIDHHQGQVPVTMEALLELPGVGRKTANLVLVEGFHEPAVCVDVHVHRISNRVGLVTTRSPSRTEDALRRNLPRRHWIRYNELLVAFGQQVCRPVSPICSDCPVTHCPKIGVTHHR